MWGISYPGLYAAYGLIGSHPALKAVSPQAPMGDVGNGDDAYHNGAFYLAANFGFYTGFKPRGPEPERPARTVPFEYGTADQYDFYLKMGPLANANEKHLKNTNAYWNDLLARHVRRVLAVARAGAAYEEYDSSHHVCGRVVRCGRFVRTIEAVPRRESERSSGVRDAGHGPVVARRVVARR
jgi:predicted acyl esterase